MYAGLHDKLTQPTCAGLGVALCVFCYSLPTFSAGIVGMSIWAFVMYISWQIGLAASALLLLFYYAPTVSLSLLGIAVWLLFLLILPKICIVLTEFCFGVHRLTPEQDLPPA